MAAGAWVLWRWTALGDYQNDAGPAIAALVGGHLRAYAHAHPEMANLSLLLRAPFAAAGQATGHSVKAMYVWGCVPCVAAVVALAVRLAALARSRGCGIVGQLCIALGCVVNPLVHSALDVGHPEELLTAALCVWAMLAAADGRRRESAIALGAAVACKQWALVAVLPVLFVLPDGRWIALRDAVATAVLIELPGVLIAPGSFIHNQIFLASGTTNVPAYTCWFWLVSSSAPVHPIVNATQVIATLPRIPAALARGSHPAIVLLAGAAAWLAVRRRGTLTGADGWTLLAIVLLLRCALDPINTSYYQLPVLLALFASDAWRGKLVPVRALAFLALTHVVFATPTPSTLAAQAYLYAISSFALLVWLGIELRAGGRRAAATPAPAPAGVSYGG